MTTRHERERFWTRHPRQLRLEKNVRRAMLVVGAPVMALLVVFARDIPASFRGLIPFVLSAFALLFLTTGCLTRTSRASVLSYPVLWAIFFVAAGTRVMLGSHGRSSSILAGGILLGCAGLVPLVRARFAKWQVARRLELQGIDVPRHEPTTIEHGSYCLSCFAPLTDGALGQCGECRFHNRAVDRRSFWNRNPRLMRLEKTLKALIVVGAVATIPMIVVARPVVGVGAGWVFGLAVVAAGALWRTVSALTQHPYPVEMSRVWGTFFGLNAAVFIGVGLLSWSTSSLALGCLSGASLVTTVVSARLFERYKRRLVSHPRQQPA